MGPQVSCETCDSALVLTDGTPPHNIDVAATTDFLIERVVAGRMRYLRGDVPLEDMLDLAISDMKYTIVSYLQCEDCGRTRFWGLSIRGAPIYKAVDADAPSRWIWDVVPPREKWKP